jgi:hypothetical protein
VTFVGKSAFVATTVDDALATGATVTRRQANRLHSSMLKT